MVFSSVTFLFFFLPITLTVFFIFRNRPLGRNIYLVAVSFIFYFWDEKIYTLLLVAFIVINYGFGLWIAKAGERRKTILVISLVCNLLPLVFFKYTAFFVKNINSIIAIFGASPMDVPRIHLPIGLSFFTFQIITYCIDVYRGTVEVQRDPLKLSLFISLFPKLLQGPIENYHHMAPQLDGGRVTAADFAEGVRRFIIGLGRKALVANVLGPTVDRIFAVPVEDLTAPVAWLGSALYLLQIYFDVNAYADMAIGLGRMFGYTFMENYNYAYIARSVREFWQRNHITLMKWFRDYLYIPLGGNRVSRWITYRNIMIVFIVSGIWHGAEWSFVVWGISHGIFMCFERATNRITERIWRPFGNLYFLGFHMTTMIFFRISDIAYAFSYVKVMYGITSPSVANYHIGSFLGNGDTILAIIIALIGSVPLLPWLKEKFEFFISRRRSGSVRAALSVAYGAGRLLFYAGVLLLSAMAVASDTYNPFIYFQF